MGALWLTGLQNSGDASGIERGLQGGRWHQILLLSWTGDYEVLVWAASWEGQKHRAGHSTPGGSQLARHRLWMESPAVMGPARPSSNPSSTQPSWHHVGMSPFFWVHLILHSSPLR